MTRRFLRTPVVPQMEEQDCGPACLTSVLAGFGRRTTLHEVSQVCGASRDGVTAGAVVRAATSFGLRAGGMRVIDDPGGRQRGLDRMTVPSMVLVAGPHFAVFEGFRRGRVRINDPSLGRYGCRPERFWDIFGGIAVGFAPGPDFTSGGPRLAFARTLAARMRRYRGALALAVVIALVVSLPGIVVSLLLRALMSSSQVGVGDSRSAVLACAALVGAASVVVGTWVQQLILGRVLQAMSARTSVRFLWRLLRLPGAFFHRRSLGGLVTRVQLNDGMAVLLSGRIVAAATAMVSILIYLGALIWLDATLAPVAVAVGVADVAILGLVTKRRTAELHLLHTAEARRDAVAFSGIAAIETLKSEGCEDSFFRSWAGWQSRVLGTAQSIAASTLGLFTVSTTLNTAASGVVIVLGMRQLLHGEVDYATLLAFILLMNGFLMPMSSLVGLGSELLVARAQSALLEDVETACPDPFLEPVLDATAGAPPLTGAVALRSVSFGYDANAAPLFEDLNLEVAPGEWVAIVGPSGSGKSTLARIVAGVLRPWSGHVELDGRARDDLPRAVVTTGVAYVEQHVRLYEGTVRDNLTLWSPRTATDGQLWDALRRAVADDLVRRRGGLDAARLEEGGRNLSGGEKQRLELARALTVDPAVLVLDEATSALDAETEAEVNRHLRARRTTCVIFAHRLSTVREADRVVVLQRGRIVQQGSHEELLAVAGAYRDLVGELS